MKQRLPQILIIAVALAFLEYWALLVYCDIRRPAPPGLHLRVAAGRVLVDVVEGQSMAARAGVRASDQISRADGAPLTSRLDWMTVEANLVFGQPLRLTLLRQGAETGAELVPIPASWREWRQAHGVELLVLRGVLLLTLGVAVF